MRPLPRRIRCFIHAGRGALTLLRSEPNARIHFLATLLVVGAAWWLRVEPWEAVALALAIGGVWTAEALNTAIEYLADEVSLEHRDRIKRAKDLAACAVLAAAITAMAVGVIIFAPRLIMF